MPDERAAFFTTGQFAKLCSTTKETLFHYDSLGLLKPARVGENGYRYYAASQFFDFDLIAVLQSAGCSLQEIHAYMTHREPHAFAKLLRESERKLLLEQQKLEAMRRTLKNGVAATEAALSGKPGVPWLEKLPTAWYVATPVQGDVGLYQHVGAQYKGPSGLLRPKRPGRGTVGGQHRHPGFPAGGGLPGKFLFHKALSACGIPLAV